jgi:ribosomal protein S18 acetylase RimI-like enzyme
VTRAAVTIREATAADVPQLLMLWAQLRNQGPRRGTRPPTSQVLESVEQRYLDAIANPGCRFVVATIDGDIAGMSLLSVSSASTLLDLPAVHLSHMCVADGHRRRGVGKALVTAAAAYADERGVEQVMVSVYPQQRDANRFYARLGFAPLVVRRMAPLPVLRRQLAAEDGPSVTLRRELRLRRGGVRRAHDIVRGIAPIGGQPADQ